MSVRLNGSTSGYTELDASAEANNNTIKLPASNGAANQLLKNGGTAGELTYSQATEDSAGVFAFNSGYGTVAPVYGCRAWVNFSGTLGSGTFAGGASTVTRAAGSTTATIATTTPHNLITGNKVFALSGVAVSAYTVTVVSPTVFTITTAATTALSAVPITFNFANIRAGGNVNSVAYDGAIAYSSSYIVNFAAPMPDANYAVSGVARVSSTNMTAAINISPNADPTSSCVTIIIKAVGATTMQGEDSTYANVAIFR